MKNLKSSLLWALVLPGILVNTLSAAPGVNLNQGRNGTDASPVTPVNWVNGNLGGSQAHYLESMSSPFQCVMTGLTTGVSITLVIGYDVKNSNKNSYDYLTHYSRINPHGFL